MSQMLANKYFTKLHFSLQNKKKSKRNSLVAWERCETIVTAYRLIFTKQNNGGMYMFMNTLC
jgi:hypothetical protein